MNTFLSSTIYTDPVDIKKLKFIFSAINRYASLKNKDVQSLHILEVGCGKGGITLPLASLGCPVRAFDIDARAVEYIASWIQRNAAKNLIVTVDDGYVFDDGQIYDVIIASEVFHQVLEPLRLAANIARRMLKGSYLVVTVPNGYGPWSLADRASPISCVKRWNWLRHLFGKPSYVRGAGGDRCQFYTRSGLVEMFSRFSLRTVDFAKSDSILAIFPRLRKSALFGNIDIRLADVLPYWLASGWYFVFEMERGSDD